MLFTHGLHVPLTPDLVRRSHRTSSVSVIPWWTRNSSTTTHDDWHGAAIEIARLKAPLADGDERLFVQIGIETENHTGLLD